MIGTIALSPSSGRSPASRSRERMSSVFSRSRPTRAGSSRSSASARRELAATVGGSPFEKSWGRERCSSTSHSAAPPATKPPAAPPRALPSVPVTITFSAPRTPNRSSTPRPVSPTTPIPCESSTISVAPSLVGHRRELRDRRQVALHAEHAVGDDQAPRQRGRVGDRAPQAVDVPVLVDGLVAGARQAHPVDDRRVVEPVGEHRRVAVAERVEQRLRWRSSTRRR